MASGGYPKPARHRCYPLPKKSPFYGGADRERAVTRGKEGLETGHRGRRMVGAGDEEGRTVRNGILSIL